MAIVFRDKRRPQAYRFVDFLLDTGQRLFVCSATSSNVRLQLARVTVFEYKNDNENYWRAYQLLRVIDFKCGEKQWPDDE